MLRGSALIAQDGREAVQTSGDYILIDASRPLTVITNDGFRILSCTFPRRFLSVEPARVARMTAATIPGRNGTGWLLAPFLARLGRLTDREDATVDSCRVADGVLCLIASLCESRLRDRPLRAPSQGELMLRIHAYVDANLADPGLSPEGIAAAHYISRRYLYKLFSREGTSVARWIRERRLERCRQQLRDPAHAHESVSQIGARWGLTNLTHLGRLFRDAYGCTPTEYRAC
jgi:AraC-like DNA-binding protein